MKKKLFSLMSLVIITGVTFASSSGYTAPSCRVLVHNSQNLQYAPEISIIIGTDRKDSKSSKIANEILATLTQNQNVKVNLINLADLPSSVFKSDYFEKKSKNFDQNFTLPIDRSRGLIFVIPEYDGAVPGILSYFMNHLRVSFDKKQVALVGISAGKWGARPALDAFKGTLTHRRARVLGDIQVNIENVETKFEGDRLTHEDSKKRLAESAAELVRTLSRGSDSTPYQNMIAKVSETMQNRNIEMILNNQNSIQGKINNSVVNSNGTLAYVQFSGPTRIKNKGHVIMGQDIDVHNLGYGMPVGAIRGLKPEWYKKENLAAANLTVGKKVKLEYESGVIVNGKIKKLTLDTEGNILVITFSDVVVKNGSEILFQKEWGDFDIAVGDHVERIELN